jgi:copper homeostasis protein
MPHLLLEVIVQSVADAREAARGGADRLEVVRAIRDGGLTPPVSLVRAIAAETALPLRVMVRENAGYATNGREMPVLRRAIAEFASLHVDGIVIGFARAGKLALDDLADALEGESGVRVTFHRAFDQLRDPLGAIGELAAIGQIDRILTSGGDGTAAMRCEQLRAHGARAGGRFELIAGGGVDEESLALFARERCVREVHVGRAAREGGDPEGPVAAACVRRLRELASTPASARPAPGTSAG